MNFSTLTGRKCKPSMQSVNGGRGGGGGGPNARPPAGTSEAQFRLSQPCKGPGPDWVAFSDLTQGRNSFMMNDTSAVDPLVVVLLCASVDLDGPFLDETAQDNGGGGGGSNYMVLTVDGWVKYRVPTDFATALCALRARARKAFEHHVLTGQQQQQQQQHQHQHQHQLARSRAQASGGNRSPPLECSFRAN